MKSIKILIFAACLTVLSSEHSAAQQWTNLTYDSPNVPSSCFGCGPIAPAGSPVNTSNAYIMLSSVESYPSPLGQVINLTTGTVSINQFASSAYVGQLAQSISTNSSNIGALQATLNSLSGTVSTQGQAISSLQTQNAGFASQFTAVNQQLASLSAQIAGLQRSVSDANKHAWIGSALASSLVSVAPLPGNTNRLGMNVATVQGQSAVGFNYSHASGRIDLNAGVSLSTSQSRYAEGRVGIGFNW